MSDFLRILKSILPWVILTALVGILGGEPVFLYTSLVLLLVSIIAFLLFRINSSLNISNLGKPLGIIWIIVLTSNDYCSSPE